MQNGTTAMELPSAGLLSNGRYDVVVEADGSGHAAYDGRLLTPRFGLGTCLYVQEDGLESETDRLWSAGSAPVPEPAASAEAALGPGCYRMRRTCGGLSVTSDICVVPDRDVELRRYTISNGSELARRLTVTAVTEVDTTGGPAWVRDADPAGRESGGSDVRDAGTSKRAVESEYVGRVGGVLAVRKEADGPALFLLHAFVGTKPDAHATDGEAFFGPDRAIARPPGLRDGLAGTAGRSRHPILALQTRVSLESGEDQTITLAGCVGRSRDWVVGAAESLADGNVLADVFLEAALREQRTRDELKLGPRNADRYHRVAAAILRNAPALRKQAAGDPARAVEAMRQLGLDPIHPLVVCRISDESEMNVAKLMLKARAFWQTIGLSVQVVFLNDKSGAGANTVQYDLHEAIEMAEGGADGMVLRHADTVSPDDQRSLQQAAQLILTADRIDLMRVRR